jgi:hypothetical protein
MPENFVPEPLLSSGFFKQSEFLLQGQLVAGFSSEDPDTIDGRLKLNFATGPNVVGIGNRLGQGYLEFTGYFAHFLTLPRMNSLSTVRRCSSGE